MFRLRLALSGLLLLPLSLLACGDEPAGGASGFVDPGSPDQGTPDASPDAQDEETPIEACALELEPVGGTTVGALTHTGVALTVVLADCDAVAVPDALVSFTLQGQAAGAALLARTALTDERGEATVTLRGGPTAAVFEVLVEADDAESLVLSVAVTDAPSGLIEVTVVPVGPLAYDAFTPSLYAGGDCDELGPYGLPAALQTTASIASPAAHPVFSAVPVGSGYAVVVHADKDGGVLGYGCTDEVAVIGGLTTEVEVAIGEIPVVFDGVYDLANRFDATGALPPSIADALHIFDEMTDDNSLTGNTSTEDYGLDPAAFLLDFVYRELCCWEATGSNDFGECRSQSEQHPLGDLEDLYRRDFTSWGGAQPRSFGLCGGLEFGNETIMELVQDLILDSVPGVVLDLAQMAGDLSRAFTDMRIRSELTLTDAYLAKTGGFTHELITMTVELHDLDGVLHVFEFDLADAGLSNLEYSGEATVTEGHVLGIPEHSFRVDFGRLLRYVYLNGMLPLLDCDADGNGVTEPCTSTADLFRTWVDCDSVGVWLEANVSDWISASTYAGYCRTGLTVAGLSVEGMITGSIDAETVLTLEGSAAAGVLDGQRRATELVDGVWDGLLTEDGSEVGPVLGTFAGPRVGDP